ncbi:MAG TPA: AAA family ATPase [Candidatus Solibacter sp.]|nr:AAA family ATPase [Candidatus Solibacter sp.]
MITRIEASRFRCLKAIDQPIGPFQILVGPNASGKSAFLDVLWFLSDVLVQGLDRAVSERTENFHDLVWGRQGNGFELAIEAEIPRDRRRIPFTGRTEDAIRYEMEVRIDAETDAVFIAKESLEVSRSGVEPAKIGMLSRSGNQVSLINPQSDRLEPAIAFPPSAAALPTLGGQDKSPAAAWLSELLAQQIQFVALENAKLRNPSPPSRGPWRKHDGSSVARLVAQVEDKFPRLFEDWIAHLHTSLPQLRCVRTELRREDNKRYVLLEYDNGVRVPSWVVSEGTLRLLTLTLLAYVPEFRGVYLIEEPETGVHPQALETIFQSLASVYEGQVLVTTHSPLLLGLAKPEQILCFSLIRDDVEIVRGDQHPRLQDWKGEISLGDLFAAGVLG